MTGRPIIYSALVARLREAASSFPIIDDRPDVLFEMAAEAIESLMKARDEEAK